MSLLLGTDVVCVPRIQSALDRFGDRFLRRIYTPRERQACWRGRDRHGPTNREVTNRLAGRWAAKEAIAKALGTGWSGIGYTDIEIPRSGTGAPLVCLHGAARDREHQRFGDTPVAWQLSISHDGDYAFAVAIAIGPPFTVEPSPIE